MTLLDHVILRSALIVTGLHKSIQSSTSVNAVIRPD